MLVSPFSLSFILFLLFNQIVFFSLGADSENISHVHFKEDGRISAEVFFLFFFF